MGWGGGRRLKRGRRLIGRLSGRRRLTHRLRVRLVSPLPGVGDDGAKVLVQGVIVRYGPWLATSRIGNCVEQQAKGVHVMHQAKPFTQHRTLRATSSFSKLLN